MDFTSLPLYHLDPPNWNQPNQHHQRPHQHQQPTNNESPHLISPPPSMTAQSAQNQAHGSGGGGGGSRPGSMAERARLAKIPQPEQVLKCPRCDSTNTKFCYFNNYSLSQPRHFCKTCRRYWTRGGALRNVPVGGGCRRNKRSTNNKSSSSSNNNNNNKNKSGASSAAAASSSSCSTAASGSTVIPSNFAHHQLPFLSSGLSPLADQYGASLGLNFMHQQQHIDAGAYQMEAGGGGSSLGLEQRRIQQIQQFPFLGGLDHTSSANPMTGTIYPNFDGEEAGGGEGFHVNPSKVASSSTTTSGLITQLASVKMEDSHPHGGFSLPRQYLRIPGNDQYLGGGGWAGDLSGFNSSGNML